MRRPNRRRALRIGHCWRSKPYYSFSTLLCCPSSLSQEVGAALGAQAGEARIRDVATAAGFGQFRRVAETPFNIVYEARP